MILTMKKAKEIALAALGTAKGLSVDEDFSYKGSPGYKQYIMRLGVFEVEISPNKYFEHSINPKKQRIFVVIRTPDCTSGETRLVYFPDTLERDSEYEEELYNERKHEYLEDWVAQCGSERCIERIKNIDNKQKGE